MKVDMVMPQMGESIAEGTIVRWLKNVGDLVQKDENVLEISTDKVDSEIPSPAAGRIVEIVADEGETVPVGSVVARIETDTAATVSTPEPKKPGAEQRPPLPAAAATARPAEQPSGRPAEKGKRSEENLMPSAAAGTEPQGALGGSAEPQPGDVATSLPAGRDGSSRFYSPLVRSIAQSEGIPLAELAQIPGSGQGGRLTKEDLLKHVARQAGMRDAGSLATVPKSAIKVEEVPSEAHIHPAPIIAMPEPIERRTTPDGAIDVIPMDHIRQKIAEHMVRSKATSPHVASITEVDMTRIVRWREKNKEAFERHEGFKLTYTPFFVRATAQALADFPYMNASIDGHNILVKRYINLGMAVATDYGLIVPILRGADALSFLGIARAVNDLATRARSKTLKPEDVAGGTFSITNMGTVGTLFGVPIIAQPQVGILGIGSIQKRPVVRDDAIAIRDMMYMCLSYDHRLIDGAMGGAFIERVAHNLETADLG